MIVRIGKLDETMPPFWKNGAGENRFRSRVKELGRELRVRDCGSVSFIFRVDSFHTSFQKKMKSEVSNVSVTSIYTMSTTA